MILQSLSLQNFRSYSKARFSFDPKLTVIVGPNASGKTNLVEAVSFLSTGKSFRTSKEKQVIGFGKSVVHILASVEDEEGEEKLELTLSLSPQEYLLKRYLVNGVSKRRLGFSGKLPTVLFTPLDLVLVSGQPGDKRRFLDECLEQTDTQYASAL